MSIFRRISTARLIVLCAAIVAIGVAGTALASALKGNGPIPPAKSLAQAVHDALAAPPVPGITARVSFTNHLIDSSSLQSSSPLLSGATGRLWLGAHQLRLELQSQRGNDSQLVISRGSAWFYDGASNTVYRGQLPQHASAPEAAGASGDHPLPTVAEIEKKIATFSTHANVSGAIPGDIAGQAAYTVRVSPRHDGGLLGAVAGAWDAVHGVPLRVAVYATGDSSPVLELKVTDISFGPVPASAIDVAPPTGAKVVDIRQPSSGALRARVRAHHRGIRDRQITGPAAVQAGVPFHLSAPDSLVGLPRRNVRLLATATSAAAVVTYGQGLGGIVVLERPAGPHAGAVSPKAPAAGGGGERSGSLPTISISGATGHELSTALGTLVTFERAGVSYTVVGSVPANAAEAAARGL